MTIKTQIARLVNERVIMKPKRWTIFTILGIILTISVGLLAVFLAGNDTDAAQHNPTIQALIGLAVLSFAATSYANFKGPAKIITGGKERPIMYIIWMLIVIGGSLLLRALVAAFF